jgi:hypothetical protein
VQHAHADTRVCIPIFLCVYSCTLLVWAVTHGTYTLAVLL